MCSLRSAKCKVLRVVIMSRGDTVRGNVVEFPGIGKSFPPFARATGSLMARGATVIVEMLVHDNLLSYTYFVGRRNVKC